MKINKNSLSIIAIIFVLVAFTGILSLNSSEGGLNVKTDNNTSQIQSHYANSSEGNNIITEVDYDIGYILPHWDDYETVTLKEDELKQSLEDGSVSLSLLGENVEITIIESENKNHEYYRGYAKGVYANQAEFYFGEDACSCYVSLGTHDYHIAPTEEIIDNKMIYVLYMTDREKERLRHEQYPIDPLRFDISNEDTLEHNISIEIFDPSDVSIFKENYSISPGESMTSPEISEVPGKHQFIVILDGDYRFEEAATVARSTGLGSSERLGFNIVNNSEYPIEISISIA